MRIVCSGAASLFEARMKECVFGCGMGGRKCANCVLEGSIFWGVEMKACVFCLWLDAGWAGGLKA